jgi:hypothetical protein
MKVLKNDNNVLRSGWKIGIVYLSFLITTFIISVIFTGIYSVILISRSPELLTNETEGLKYINEQFLSMTHLPGIFLYLIQCISLIFFVILFWRIWDKKKIRYIGLTNIKSSWKDLCIGLLFGAISFTIVAVTLLVTKSVELVNSFSQPSLSKALIIQLVIFIFVGINEELFSRGYCITVLKQTKVSWVPIVVSSIIFALMHAMNSGISLLAYINLFLFGITMGYLFIKTKNIWMCIGYHITWNYFQGNIFGFLVSGNTTDSIYTVKTINANIINGGNFGPEGGVVVTVLLIVTLFVIYKFMPNREEI